MARRRFSSGRAPTTSIRASRRPPMSYTAQAASFTQKANAIVMLMAASALFVATVIWPVASPFVTGEFDPARTAQVLDNTLEEFLELVR